MQSFGRSFFFSNYPLMFSWRFPTPELEGRSNLTTLDIQIKKLRDSALSSILNAARRMREEAREIADTLPEIEAWLDKLNQLAKEVQTQEAASWLMIVSKVFLKHIAKCFGYLGANSRLCVSKQ